MYTALYKCIQLLIRKEEKHSYNSLLITIVYAVGKYGIISVLIRFIMATRFFCSIVRWGSSADRTFLVDVKLDQPELSHFG